jgi:hypothetical protein
LSDLAAMAHAEAARVGAACEFILDVIEAQIHQGRVQSAVARARFPIAVGLQSVDSDNGANTAAALNAGGPG